MRIYLGILLITIEILWPIKLIAQSDTGKVTLPEIELSAYMDNFYVYDFNQPTTDFRQNFLYNHNRHNAFNLNLGVIKISAQHQKYRANLALLAGTYATDNYAKEPAILKNIFEANAGISLTKHKNLWIDAGVFASHIGFESAISSDNWTLTRSILAENSPYYLTGVKLTYTPNAKIELMAIICNGWQRIQMVKGNALPSFGTQFRVVTHEKVTLNWSTFIGTDDPDSTRRMRFFNNFYGQFQFSKKIGLIAGLDIGAQQRSKNSSRYNMWFSPVIIAQFLIGNHWKTAIRAEYYEDKTGIIIPTGTLNGFRTSGISLNLDYQPRKNLFFRLEGRWFNSKDKIFKTQSGSKRDNFCLGTSVAIKFSEVIKNY